MNVNEIITLIIQAVLLPLIAYGLTLAKGYIQERVKTEQVRRAMEQSLEAVHLAVSKTAQVYVDGIKGSPTWNESAQLEAAQAAQKTARQIIGSEAYKLLQTVTGDAEAFLTAAIEAEVRAQKGGR